MVNVIDACRKHGIGKLVLASSSEVYQTPLQIPTDETAALTIPDPLNPRYSYGGGKLISELMAINFGRKHFDRVMIFRESHYLVPLLDTLQYDTIYHEHLRYYSLASLKHLLEMHGFKVFHARPIPSHGGSIRVYAAPRGTHAVQESVARMLATEPRSRR